MHVLRNQGDSLHAVESGVPKHLARHPIVCYRAGKVLLQQRAWAPALAKLHAAAQGDPEQPGLFSHAAFVLRMLGQNSAARRALRAARALDQRDQWVAPQLLQLHRNAGVSLVPPERGAIQRRSAPSAPTLPIVEAEVALVTAANSLYFGCVANLVGSVHRHAAGLPIVLYDLGLNEMERDSASAWAGVSVQRLDWAGFGPHVTDIRIKAWKPFAIAHALSLFPKIIYQDAGQELRQGMHVIHALLRRDGYFFAVQQEKILPKHVHPAMMKHLAIAPEAVTGYDMCAAGILALSNASAAAREVVQELVDCARERECIAPAGASQQSHRYEQAVLSLALARRNIRCHNRLRVPATAACLSVPLALCMRCVRLCLCASVRLGGVQVRVAVLCIWLCPIDALWCQPTGPPLDLLHAPSRVVV